MLFELRNKHELRDKHEFFFQVASTLKVKVKLKEFGM